MRTDGKGSSFMESHLVEMFKQNQWANQKLLDFCEGLDTSLLDATAAGVFGTVHDTLRHILNAEIRYIAILTSPRPDELSIRDETLPLIAELKRRNIRAGEGLIRCAKEIPDGTILKGEDREGDYQAPASNIFVQAFNHSTDHRSQISTILTQHGIEPPELDGWTYLWEVTLGHRTSS
jgi:uncharacterized damage-inducible protein DinB